MTDIKIDGPIKRLTGLGDLDTIDLDLRSVANQTGTIYVTFFNAGEALRAPVIFNQLMLTFE